MLFTQIASVTLTNVVITHPFYTTELEKEMEISVPEFVQLKNYCNNLRTSSSPAKKGAHTKALLKVLCATLEQRIEQLTVRQNNLLLIPRENRGTNFLMDALSVKIAISSVNYFVSLHTKHHKNNVRVTSLKEEKPKRRTTETGFRLGSFEITMSKLNRAIKKK
jgi:hypothetical protein